MTLRRDASVDELRRQSESARATLASTVSKLREEVSDTAENIKMRLSPSHMKKEVGEYVREGSEQIFHSLERKAGQNPLQAVAVGAALLYPIWGLFKTVPAPVMLIGAGWWLSKQKKSERYVHDIVDKASEKGSEIAESMRETGTALRSQVGEMSENVKAAAQDVQDSVTSTARRAGEAVTERAVNASESASAAAATIRDKGVQFGNQSRSAVEHLVDENPLLVAGIGLAIGAFIAASLPASNMENRLFGKSSDDVKDKALKAASDGVERAKDVAAGVAGDLVAAAAREHLNADGVAKAVAGITQGVRAVVDKGLNTALRAEDHSGRTQAPADQYGTTPGEL